MIANLPYPTNAIPELFFNAGCNVGARLRCADELIAQGMQAVASAAVQSILEVDVPTFGRSPTNLWFLTVAASGEGKNAVQTLLTRGLNRFADVVAERYGVAKKEYVADHEAWRAEHDGIRRKLTRLSASDADLMDLKAITKLHQLEKPVEPMPYCLCLEEFDKKSLIEILDKNCRYIYIDSPEASSILNNRLKKNSNWLVRLYSGETISLSWTSSSLRSYSVKGALATFNLMIQPKPFSDLLGQAGDELIGSGFLPRFLPAYPQSQRGRRFIDDRVLDTNGIDQFNDRIYDILHDAPYFSNRSDSKILMTLSPQARRMWVDARNAMEASMAPGAALFSVPEFASRLAANALRMAANWQYTAHGNAEITASTLAGAIEVCKWHAVEFIRMFSEDAQLPDPVQDAMKLDAFLGRKYHANGYFQWPLLHLQRCVERSLRKKDRFAPALQILVLQGKISIYKNEFGSVVQLNLAYYQSVPPINPQMPLISAL